MKRYLILIFILVFVFNLFALKGDINKDGIVDGYDLIILARSFGSEPGDPNYNLAADLSGNSRIDGQDLSLLAASFGRRSDGNSIFNLIINSSVASDQDPNIADLGFYGVSPSLNRYKLVDLTPEITTGNNIAPGDEIILNLFQDKEYSAYIDRIHTNINGTLAIRGRIQNYDYSYIIITSTDGETLITINLPEVNEFYRISSYPHSNMLLLAEKTKDNMDILENASALIPPEETDYETVLQEAIAQYIDSMNLGPGDHADIDMMIVYTPAAADWANIQGGIANVIAQAMERAQLTLENSAVIASANLVLFSQVDYVESGDSAIDLYRLTASPDYNPWGAEHDGYPIPGFMDEVHSWRDASGADLVAIFTRAEDVGGLGWLLNNPAGRPQLGFSLTRVQQAASSYTHIHEVGHNMGAHHHKEQLTSPGPGIFNYSAGWRWTGTDGGRYCSVMTYTAGRHFADGITHAEVPYFSNPDIYHFGVPTGHPQHGDNARTLRETKHVIASYRTAVGVPPEAPTNLTIEVLSTDSIRLNWTRNSDNELGFAIEERMEGEGDFIEIGRSSPGATSYTVSIDPAFTHYYRIRAFNQHGYSAYSNTAEITIGMGW